MHKRETIYSMVICVCMVKNRFDKAKTIGELETMYLDALRTGEDLDLIEDEYILRKKQLLGTFNIEEESEKPKPKTKKSKQHKVQAVGEDKTFMTIYVRGNQELPAFEPVFEAGKTYEAVNLDYGLLYKAIKIRDYAPVIKDNKLYSNNVKKMSQVVEIEQDIEISIEDGEDVQLHEAYFTQNESSFINDGNKNHATVVITYLLNPQNNHIKYKLLSMWAYEDGVLTQVKMTPAH